MTFRSLLIAGVMAVFGFSAADNLLPVEASTIRGTAISVGK
jgi:hypothetical protein